MTPRDALVARIRHKREQKQRLQDKLDALNVEIDSLVAQRDALAPGHETVIADLQALQIVRVED
jgi:uncharacterized coiled-coil DUF342 family protein